MGILTRMMNKDWLIEVKEKWFFASEKEASDVQFQFMIYKIPYSTKIEEVDGKSYVTIELDNAVIKPTSFAEMIKFHTKICELLSKNE